MFEPRKVAIVTGASQGIGAGLVAAFRRAGYAVVATSLTTGGPAAAARSLATEYASRGVRVNAVALGVEFRVGAPGAARQPGAVRR